MRIGQIGIGHNHGAEKMSALRRLEGIFEVVGVAEPDENWRARRGGLPAYRGLPWMDEAALLNTPGLEAVAVETDGADLVPTAARCIAAGKHVHLDKPGGETPAPFRALLEEAGRRNLTVQMGYMFRNNPAVQFCLRAVREGWLGRVFEVHAVMSRLDGPEYRRWLANFAGGAMYIFGGHLVDIVVAMLGRPERVSAYQRRTRPEADGLYDNGFAVLEYPGAVASVRTTVVEVGGVKRRQLTVCGERGTVEIRPLEPPDLRLVLAGAAGPFSAGEHRVELAPMPGRYDEQLAEFARVVRGEIENPWPPAHELAVQETLLMAAGYPVAPGAAVKGGGRS